jgi:hypothetical protein
MSEAKAQQPEWKPGAIRSPTDFTALPHGTQVTNISFTAEDGPTSQGVLYRQGGERTVVCVTHPRGDLTRHYMTPYLLAAGYAVCGMTHRALITDFALMHEAMVLDIAACLRRLKSDFGFDRVVLLANSGGGGIFGLYQWQAETAPPGRLAETPSGDPPDLNRHDLPAADGLILLATPFGESSVVTRGIDPSVIDEDDPLSCDSTLDMYDSRNGYREPPAASRYSEEFKTRYLAAQQQRIARIDTKARAMIAEQRRYQAQMRDPGYAGLSVEERSYSKRRAADTPPLLVYRTDASLAYCDLTLYPSKRSVGTFFMADTQFLNHCRQTLGQFKAPRAWLSASSGLSSNSTLRKALPHIAASTVVINFTADRGVYPADSEELLALSASADKQLHHVDGDHFGLPVESLGDPAPRDTVARILSPWLRERFAAR